MKGVMFILGVMILASCGDTSEQSREQDLSDGQDTSSYQVEESVPKHALLTTYDLKTGTSLVVVEKKKSASRSLITVQGSGFSESQQVLTFRNVNPIESAEVHDLDGDGYEEVYIITRSTDPALYGSIIGVASVKDKTYEPIIFPELEEGDPNFGGYKGLDRFRFAAGRLLRDIPIYRPKDPIRNPTGGVRILAYDLERTDNGLELVVQRSSEH